MKIVCTVKEFGQIVRGCEKSNCYNCPFTAVCGGNEDEGIERFISACDVVDEPEPERVGEDG